MDSMLGLYRAGCLRWVCCLVLITTLVPETSGKELLFKPGQHGHGKLQYSGHVPIALFAGTPQEIGEQHAALIAKSSAPLHQYPEKMFAVLGLADQWPAAVQASKKMLQQVPERFREELDAMVKGAGLNGDAMNVANAILELRQMGCSVLVVEPERSASGGPLFGRNFDFPSLGLLDRYGIVMVYHPLNQHAFVSIGYPGLIGVVSGMNDAGLALAVLDVYKTADDSPRLDLRGVPQIFVFRQILEQCTTVTEARRLLENTQATTYLNLAVCDRDRGMIFEITPNGVAVRESVAGLLPCTNHFRTEGLCVNKECSRYNSLLGAAKQPKLDIASIQQGLHAAHQGELTLQTMIFEPRELRLHLSLGPPPSSAERLQKLELGKQMDPFRTGSNKDRMK